MKTLHFPGFNNVNDSIDLAKQEDPLLYGSLFDYLINYFELTMITFCCLTIRCYEKIIHDEPDDYKKKINPIKKILRERFKAPTLGTLVELTRNCFHLINNNDGIAPKGLLNAKECLDQNIQLGLISYLLNDFAKIVNILRPEENNKKKTIYREPNRLHIIGKLIPQIVEVRNTVKHSRDLSVIINDNFQDLELNIDNWRSAVKQIIDYLLPVNSHRYVRKTLGKMRKNNSKSKITGKTSSSFLIETTIYSNGNKDEVQEEQEFIDLQEIQDFQKINYTEILLETVDGAKPIDLFPFLMIDDDKLYFYKATRARGYEYFSMVDNSSYLIETKKKFSHSAFKIGGVGDQQAIFWTEVLPSKNPKNNIVANIPIEGSDDFVGRRKQIRKICEEVIEIPNQDGILFGPGGVGKTALMLQLSKELYDEVDKDKIIFNNIIWVSAKRDYYNPFLNFVEKKERQIETLDNIFSAVLAFFEFENSDEYGFDDKQSLILELLYEKEILLVVDNFETISKVEQDKIVKFFVITVKKHLRKKPDNFKVLLTSREQIPSGFHQIKLEGLDLRETKLLIKKLHEKYKGSTKPLSQEQCEFLHKSSSGIPIIIKHCIGQVFEYNKPFDSVCQGLCNASSEVIKFSYDEIFKLLRKNEDQLKIIILLELVNCPLSTRQISDILEIDEVVIKSSLPALISFQCIERINIGVDEKYFISDNVQLLSKGLLSKEDIIQKEIRGKIIKNFTLDKKMDYTTEEMNIIEIFNKYISENNFIEAEDFLNAQLKKHKKSILLKYHFAKYLKEHRREIESAIELLKSIDKDGFKHPNILRLMVSCYTSMEIPKYDRANKYVNELYTYTDGNDNLKIEISEFYIGWSTFIKESPRLLDPIKEFERKSRYKEVAEFAVDILLKVNEENKDIRYYYLISHGYYNMWKNDKALEYIDFAIKKSTLDTRYLHSCYRLRRKILKHKES